MRLFLVQVRLFNFVWFLLFKFKLQSTYKVLKSRASGIIFTLLWPRYSTFRMNSTSQWDMQLLTWSDPSSTFSIFEIAPLGGELSIWSALFCDGLHCDISPSFYRLAKFGLKFDGLCFSVLLFDCYRCHIWLLFYKTAWRSMWSQVKSFGRFSPGWIGRY